MPCRKRRHSNPLHPMPKCSGSGRKLFIRWMKFFCRTSVGRYRGVKDSSTSQNPKRRGWASCFGCPDLPMAFRVFQRCPCGMDRGAPWRLQRPHRRGGRKDPPRPGGGWNDALHLRHHGRALEAEPFEVDPLPGDGPPESQWMVGARTGKPIGFHPEHAHPDLERSFHGNLPRSTSHTRMIARPFNDPSCLLMMYRLTRPHARVSVRRSKCAPTRTSGVRIAIRRCAQLLIV